MLLSVKSLNKDNGGSVWYQPLNLFKFMMLGSRLPMEPLMGEQGVPAQVIGNPTATPVQVFNALPPLLMVLEDLYRPRKAWKAGLGSLSRCSTPFEGWRAPPFFSATPGEHHFRVGVSLLSLDKICYRINMHKGVHLSFCKLCKQNGVVGDLPRQVYRLCSG